MSWTLETLKEFFETRLTERDQRFCERDEADKEALAAAVVAVKEAVTKAEVNLERRLEGMNEFRRQLSEQVVTFVSRGEYMTWRESQEKELKTLTSRLDRIEAKGAGLSAGWGYLLGVVGIGIALFSLLRH